MSEFPVGLRWLDDAPRDAGACVICGDAGPKREMLTVESTITGNDPLTLVRCEACTGRYFPRFVFPDYSVTFGEEGVQYYIEQGAGIDIMLGPLFCIPPEPGRRYLEIGCGFGFSLDFAQRTLRWDAQGYDPSFLARAGKRVLGIEIELDYWNDQSQTGEPFDLIYASEVIEHVGDPAAFVARAAAGLKPHGAVLLATPNAESLTRQASDPVLYAILSPGYHVVLLTEQAMRLVLERAGLPHVHIWKRDATLFALGSRVPLDVVGAPDVQRAPFRAYLEERLRDTPVGTALGCGLAYRLFKDFANQGEWPAAAGALVRVHEEARVRFGLDLDDPGSIDPHAATLAEFARRWPFNLCSSLYFQGMLELNHRARPARAKACFEASVRSGVAIRAALATGFLDDGETADLVRLSRDHAALAESRCG